MAEEGPLERAWTIIRRRKLVIVQALVIIPLVVFAVTLTQSDKYSASATLLFEAPALGLVDESSGFQDPDRAVATNIDLASLPVVAERTAEQLGISAGAVLSSVEVEPSNSSDIAQVIATSESPAEAARIATAYAQSYIDFRRESSRAQLAATIQQLEESLGALGATDTSAATELRDRIDRLRLAESVQTGNAELVQPAQAPTEPSSPNLKQNMALGFILALAVAFALAALLERLDRRIKEVDELERVYERPVLARIPRSKALGRRSSSFETLAGRGGETESFRTLRANLRYFNVDGAIQSLMVASPMAGDGKSTIASYLAMTMAAMGDNVVLVDADLHKGNSDIGLSSVLAGASLDDAMVEMELPFADGEGTRKLYRLGSGPPPPNPYEMLESSRMRSLIDELEQRFDLVLIDSPALSAVSDGLALVPAVSGVLIVSALGHTTRDSAIDLRKQLQLLQGRPLGVVANFSNPERSGYYHSGPISAPGA